MPPVVVVVVVAAAAAAAADPALFRRVVETKRNETSVHPNKTYLSRLSVLYTLCVRVCPHD